MTIVSRLDTRICITETHDGWFIVSFLAERLSWAATCASQAEAEEAGRKAARLLQDLDSLDRTPILQEEQCTAAHP